MVAVEKQLGFRERTERERVSDMWTSFFEREHPEIKSENVPALVEKVLDLITNIKDFDEQNARIKEIYTEFGVEIRNKVRNWGQVWPSGFV